MLLYVKWHKHCVILRFVAVPATSAAPPPAGGSTCESFVSQYVCAATPANLVDHVMDSAPDPALCQALCRTAPQCNFFTFLKSASSQPLPASSLPLPASSLPLPASSLPLPASSLPPSASCLLFTSCDTLEGCDEGRRIIQNFANSLCYFVQYGWLIILLNFDLILLHRANHTLQCCFILYTNCGLGQESEIKCLPLSLPFF